MFFDRSLPVCQIHLMSPAGSCCVCCFCFWISISDLFDGVFASAALLFYASLAKFFFSSDFMTAIICFRGPSVADLLFFGFPLLTAKLSPLLTLSLLTLLFWCFFCVLVPDLRRAAVAVFLALSFCPEDAGFLGVEFLSCFLLMDFWLCLSAHLLIQMLPSPNSDLCFSYVTLTIYRLRYCLNRCLRFQYHLNLADAFPFFVILYLADDSGKDHILASSAGLR